LISLCKNPINPAVKAVKDPKKIIKFKAKELNSKIKDNLIHKYIPAVTIVAACISADTGVGPSIASGSQTCSPI
jgi:hypothetical protein